MNGRNIFWLVVAVIALIVLYNILQRNGMLK